MPKRALSAAQAGYSVRRWTCAAFLPYRALAYSADCPVAAAAHQFLRYRGSEQNECPLPNGKLAVFLPYRLARMLTVRRCAARMDFLPCRNAEGPAKLDALLSAANCPPYSMSGQPCCADGQLLAAYFVPDWRLDDLAFLRRRWDLQDCGTQHSVKQACLASRLELPPFRARLSAKPVWALQAAARTCCAAARIRSVPSAPVCCCCDTTFLRDRPADWYCAADFDLPFFLPHRTKPRQHDSVPMRCCVDGIPTGNVRSVPAAYSARPRCP